MLGRSNQYQVVHMRSLFRKDAVMLVTIWLAYSKICYHHHYHLFGKLKWKRLCLIRPVASHFTLILSSTAPRFVPSRLTSSLIREFLSSLALYLYLAITEPKRSIKQEIWEKFTHEKLPCLPPAFSPTPMMVAIYTQSRAQQSGLNSPHQLCPSPSLVFDENHFGDGVATS